mgnify:FL=1
MSQIDTARMDALSRLFEITGKDWVLRVDHLLTEPTCPTAYVHPEGDPSDRYRADRDTIEEAINAAVDMAYRELVLGEKITPEFPAHVNPT